MTLSSWFRSRHTCPKYIVYCTCDHDTSAESNFDWWSFAHIGWGAVYSIPLFLWDQDIVSFFIVLFCACMYEIVENTECGSKLFAMLCCTKDYTGDNFWNSVCDVLCCLVGFCFMFTIKLTIYSSMGAK